MSIFENLDTAGTYIGYRQIPQEYHTEMNLTLEQHNTLISLSKNNIPFVVTGRYSYQSDIEPSDVDLIIQKKYISQVDSLLARDSSKKEGSKPDPETNKERVFYGNKIDVLFVDNDIEWEEYTCFSRVVNGIRFTHPAHSMLAKVRMIMKTVDTKHFSSFKHAKDLEEYIRGTLCLTHKLFVNDQ